MPNDLRTKAIVLRRTNYGESDRILNLLTPEGKVSVMARGVRKSKSRLAGGIELFTLAEVMVHQGKSDLGTLTSAKMLKFYNNILTDMGRLELAGQLLKHLDRVAEQVTASEHFTLLQQALMGLDRGLSTDLITTWFWLNLARVNGEEINLLCDVGGNELDPDLSYHWDFNENALTPHAKGAISVREIKFARFLLSNQLLLAAQVQGYAELLPPLLQIAKSLA